MQNMDTAEKESNYTRINLLLVKGGTMVAKRLFLQRVKDLSPQGIVLTVEDFLNTNKERILNSYTGKHKEQTLYPSRGSTNVDEWDLHLLCFILIEVCDLRKIHKTDVEKLQKMRNKLCHLPEPTLSQEDFEERLEKLKVIFQRTQRLIKDKAFEEEIDALVAKYENEPIPFDEIVKFNHNFLRSELERTEILGNQKKMLEMTSEMKQNISTLVDLVEQINRSLRHESSSEVPGMNIIINVLNCTKDKEKTVLDYLVELFNKRISRTKSNDIENLTNEAWHKVSEEVVKTFEDFLEMGRHLVKVEKKCLLLRVQCDSIPTFTKLVRDCLDGSILNQLHGLLTAVRSLEGYDKVEFRQFLHEEDIVNTMGELVTNLQKALSTQKDESALMMTPHDNKMKLIGESGLRGSSYMLSLTIFPDTLTQLQELTAFWSSGAFEEGLATVQEALRNQSPDLTELTIAARLLELEPDAAVCDTPVKTSSIDSTPESNKRAIPKSTKRSIENTFMKFSEGSSSSEPSSFRQDRKKTRKGNDDSDDLSKGVALCLDLQEDTPDVWKASGDSLPETTCIHKFPSGNVDEKAIPPPTKISRESPFRKSDDDRSSSGPSSFTRDKNKKEPRKKNDDSDDLGKGVPLCLERQNEISVDGNVQEESNSEFSSADVDENASAISSKMSNIDPYGKRADSTSSVLSIVKYDQNRKKTRNKNDNHPNLGKLKTTASAVKQEPDKSRSESWPESSSSDKQPFVKMEAEDKTDGNGTSSSDQPFAVRDEESVKLISTVSSEPLQWSSSNLDKENQKLVSTECKSVSHTEEGIYQTNKLALFDDRISFLENQNLQRALSVDSGRQWMIGNENRPKLMIPIRSGDRIKKSNKKDDQRNAMDNFKRNFGRKQKNNVTPTEDPQTCVKTEDDVYRLQWKQRSDQEFQRGQSAKADRMRGMDTIFCLDLSESMKGKGWQEGIDFVRKFVEELQNQDILTSTVYEHVALVTFGHDTRVQQHLTCDYMQFLEKLENLKPEGLSPMYGGLHMMHAAIASAGEMFRTNGYNIPPRVFIITDGKATPSSFISGPDECSRKEFLKEKEHICDAANDMHEKFGITINPIPVGQHDTTILELIARSSKGRMVASSEWQMESRVFMNYLLAAKTGAKLKSREFVKSVIEHDHSDKSELDKMQMEEFLKRHKHQSDVDQEDEKIEYNPEYWRSQPNTPSADVSEGETDEIKLTPKDVENLHKGLLSNLQTDTKHQITNPKESLYQSQTVFEVYSRTKGVQRVDEQLFNSSIKGLNFQCRESETGNETSTEVIGNNEYRNLNASNTFDSKQFHRICTIKLPVPVSNGGGRSFTQNEHLEETTGQWSWHDVDKLIPFSADVNDQIEREYQRNPKGKTIIRINNTEFRICFERMIQVNLATTERRNISRTEKYCNILSIE